MITASQMAHNLSVLSVGKAHRMRLAVRLYRMGWQQKEIAAVVGVGANTISKYIRQARELYQQQAADDIRKWVADCLLVLDDVEQTAMVQWQESLNRKRIKTKVTTSGQGSVTTENWEETLEPDILYLRIRLDVVKQRRDLLNLDKEQAKVIELRGRVSVDRTAEVTQAEADAIAAALAGEALREIA